jgi:hypothetical protein
MTDEATKTTKASAPAEDLSREIEQTVDRKPDEQVRTVRLFGDCYRCNWWVEDKKSYPFWLVTGTIRRSQFIRATRTSTGLHVENLGAN